MPQYGRITKASVQCVDPTDVSGYPAPPWKLPGAEVLHVAIEADTEAALDYLLEQLTRPVPAYAKLTVTRYPESPMGAFFEAMLLVACRYRVRWLQFVAASIVDHPQAAKATAALWSYPRELGTIALERTGNQVCATVAGASGPILSIHMPNLYAVDPAMIRYDVTVTLRAYKGGEPEVLIVSGPPDVKEGWLAKGTTVTYHDTRPDTPWTRLRNLNIISSTYARVNVEWPARERSTSQPRLARLAGSPRVSQPAFCRS